MEHYSLLKRQVLSFETKQYEYDDTEQDIPLEEISDEEYDKYDK